MQFNPQEHPNSKRVGSFKCHSDKKILVYEMKEDEFEYARKVIKRRYRHTIDYNKWRANVTLQPFYGKPLLFADKVTSEVTYRIKEMIQETGKDIEEIAQEFRNYLGYRTPFFRKEGERMIPVDSQRIMKAYKAMKERKTVKEIEKILFF